jgi:hypothetical protein
MQEIPSKNESWSLIRHGIVFQLKLGLDALRDILMSPVSIVLIVADIVMTNNHQQSYFIRLMRIGKKSDRWINLFAADLPDAKPSDSSVAEDSNVDYWFSKIETVVKEQQVDGKLTKKGKEKLQQYFGQINQPPNKPENED